jgi:hypothetical protein
MTKVKIDFNAIRGLHAVEKAKSFEQLICYLAALSKETGIFRRVEGSGGDGGVEAIRILESGQVIGYQAKFFPGRINWSQVRNSVSTALDQYKDLVTYVIAFPRDFTGKREARAGSTAGIWGTWDEQVLEWRSEAQKRGMSVEFEPWTAFEIEEKLLLPSASHLLRPFFEIETFSREWLGSHLTRTTNDLAARYSPSEHVDTESLRIFEVIKRGKLISDELRKIFAYVRSSEPRAAAELVDIEAAVSEHLDSLDKAQRAFLSLESAIDWKIDRRWPIDQWECSWENFVRPLNHLNNFLSRQSNSNDSTLREAIYQKTKIYDLIRPEVFAGQWHQELYIERSKAALLIGSAGIGKSHTLARGAESAWSDGLPVIHLLGQYFTDSDPRRSVVNKLEIPSWTFHEVLTALNLMAEIADTRALFIIDALNEGQGLEIWRQNIGSFIQEIRQHDRIFLVMSCREEYLDYVIPPGHPMNPRPGREAGRQIEDLAAGQMITFLSLRGFSSFEEREKALAQFMDLKGIARPTAPILDPQLYNPLFLTSVCRSMAKAGIKIFPNGLDGAQKVFQFVLDAKAMALGSSHDGTPRVRDSMYLALHKLTAEMVEFRRDYVPLSRAEDIVSAAFKSLRLTGNQTWLSLLEGSDVLRRDVDRSSARPNSFSPPIEVIRYSFQRLQDNLVGCELLEILRQSPHPSPFDDDGPLAFMVQYSQGKEGRRLRPRPAWTGAMGSLWAAFAENYKAELFRICTPPQSNENLVDAEAFRKIFLISIRERAKDAFFDETEENLKSLWQDLASNQLAIIFIFSCIPNHRWNAIYLSAQLKLLSRPQREQEWFDRFEATYSDQFGQATMLLSWIRGANISMADPEVVRLASLTLAWLLPMRNQEFRQQVSLALKMIVSKTKELPSFLDSEMQDVEEPEIQAFLSELRLK